MLTLTYAVKEHSIELLILIKKVMLPKCADK